MPGPTKTGIGMTTDYIRTLMRDVKRVASVKYALVSFQAAIVQLGESGE